MRCVWPVNMALRSATWADSTNERLQSDPKPSSSEFERLQPLFDLGGYIPYLDHFVPPDVSLDNYLYYRRRKCEIIGKEWREPDAVRGR